MGVGRLVWEELRNVRTRDDDRGTGVESKANGCMIMAWDA